MKTARIVAVALVAVVSLLAGQQASGYTKLKSLHGTMIMMTSEDTGRPYEVWAKGNNTRVERTLAKQKLVSIQLGDTIYTYIEGSNETGRKQRIERGLGSMGLIKQIEEIQRWGSKHTSEQIEGERYDRYEYEVNAPRERATVYLSVKTSLPRIWVSTITSADGTVSVQRMLYRDMEANPYISNDMFRLPRGVTFSEESETTKPQPAGEPPQSAKGRRLAGPEELKSLHGTMIIMTGEDEGPAFEIWAKGNNTRVEMTAGKQKVVTISLGDTMYTYTEGSKETGRKQRVERGLASMGIIKQIEEIQARGKKRGSEVIEGERYDDYEYDVNFPEERAEVYLSAKTSLPRIWVSVIKTGDKTISVLRMVYRDMEANPRISDEMFELPRDVTFSEEPETTKPQLPGETPQSAQGGRLAGPEELESLHGTMITTIGEDEGVPAEIWAEGDYTRVEITDAKQKVISIQLGDTIYTYIEGSKENGKKQDLGGGLASMGLIKQIEEVKARGKKQGSEEIEGVRYDTYEYDVNAPGERATVYLSAETSLPRTWVSTIMPADGTVSVRRMLYRDMEANPYISNDMFRLPWDVTFLEEPETTKPQPAGETPQSASGKLLAGLKEIGSLQIEADGWDIVYHQGLILIAAGVNGLIVVDVSDTTLPKVLGRVAIQDMAISVAAEGTYAYVGSGPAGYPLAFLNVVDISDPRAPKVVAKLDLPDYPAGLAVRDKIVYLADRSEGLRIISVENPVAPEEIASVTGMGYASDVALADHHALVSSRDQGTVRAIDVSSPKEPVVVGQTTLETESGRLAVFGRTAFVCMGEAGVAVLDISDPSQLRRMRDVDTPGAAVALVAAADRLVIADMDGLCLAHGVNYSEIEKRQNEEDMLTCGLSEGEGHIFVLDGLAPASLYGIFGEIAIRVLRFE